jgi:hypothetical protein
MNQYSTSVTFADGKFVKREDQAEYFGTILTANGSNAPILANRLAKATSTSNKPGIFWNKANNIIGWKLRVFGAIIRCQVLYGLETVQLTRSEQQKINAFQMKRIRRNSPQRTYTGA